MKQLVTLGIAFLACSEALAGCGELHGDFTQGGIVQGRTAPGGTVKLDGELMDVLPDGTFFLGFGRDAATKSLLSVKMNTDVCIEPLSIIQRNYNIQRVEGVPQKTATPSKEHQARIARERALVSNAKARQIDRPDLLKEALSGFDWPAIGPKSGVYGSQRFYNGVPGSPHYGVDVALPAGSPVIAPSSGIVTLAESDLFFSGGTIILDHGYRFSSSFLHLSKIDVELGQEVKRGEKIGEIGSTGRATGPHLDWRMSWRRERIDPELLVPPMPGQE